MPNNQCRKHFQLLIMGMDGRERKATSVKELEQLEVQLPVIEACKTHDLDDWATSQT